MKTCLHLYNENSEDSVFWQILDHTITLQEGEIFEYNESIYNQLDEKAKTDFQISNVKFGKFRVIATKQEKNEYYGVLKYIFLKPI